MKVSFLPRDGVAFIGDDTEVNLSQEQSEELDRCHDLWDVPGLQRLADEILEAHKMPGRALDLTVSGCCVDLDYSIPHDRTARQGTLFGLMMAVAIGFGAQACEPQDEAAEPPIDKTSAVAADSAAEVDCVSNEEIREVHQRLDYLDARINGNQELARANSNGLRRTTAVAGEAMARVRFLEGEVHKLRESNHQLKKQVQLLERCVYQGFCK